MLDELMMIIQQGKGKDAYKILYNSIYGISLSPSNKAISIYRMYKIKKIFE